MVGTPSRRDSQARLPPKGFSNGVTVSIPSRAVEMIFFPGCIPRSDQKPSPTVFLSSASINSLGVDALFCTRQVLKGCQKAPSAFLDYACPS